MPVKDKALRRNPTLDLGKDNRPCLARRRETPKDFARPGLDKARLAQLVEILAPYKGCVYDPCCGSGGMFVSSEKFIEEHRGRVGDISIYGQESNCTTWRLANMNLAIRGIGANIAQGDSFHADA